MSEEGSESYWTSVKQFEIEEEFYTGGQPVCVFLYIIRHQQDLLKEQEFTVWFHCVAIHQACSILYLIPRQLTF